VGIPPFRAAAWTRYFLGPGGHPVLQPPRLVGRACWDRARNRATLPIRAVPRTRRSERLWPARSPSRWQFTAATGCAEVPGPRRVTGKRCPEASLAKPRATQSNRERLGATGGTPRNYSAEILFELGGDPRGPSLKASATIRCVVDVFAPPDTSLTRRRRRTTQRASSPSIHRHVALDQPEPSGDRNM